MNARNPARRAPALRRCALAACFVALVALQASPAAADDGPGIRERVRLDTGWRFHRGDPEDGVSLAYDVLPAEAGVPTRADVPLLKPWILPSANAFIRDPGARHPQPGTAPPGDDLPFIDPDFDDSAWESVVVPHDWAIGGPFLETGPYGGMGRLPSWGIGWYRLDLDIPAADEGRSIFLDIEGAMAFSTVWLNGELVGGWPYGYNSYRLDLTPHVVPGGTNLLAVRLDNLPDSARWYPGGGLYRDVWLVRTDPVRVAQWGTQVSTPAVSAEQANVRLDVTIDNATDEAVTAAAFTEIFDIDAAGVPYGAPVATIEHPSVTLAAGASGSSAGETVIRRPRLWGPAPDQVPHRYLAVTTVRAGNRISDRYETRFGIRDVRFDADRGLVVNGVPVPLRGVNNHHDLGALGAAFNVRAAERQLEILQAMGANAVRTAHNPPAPALLELTDRMGILVVDEIFDVWQRRKTPLDFHLVFDDWHEADLRAFIRRDRNHPSVILWSVGNEVGEQLAGDDGAAIARRLVAIAHEEDPSRAVTAAMNWSNAGDPLPETLDVVSLNYQGVGIRTLPSDFPEYRARLPQKPIFSSESAAALSSRGEYQFPVFGGRSGPVRPGIGGDPATLQVSAYELYAADFGSSADKSFALHDQHPWVAGEFVWSGFDYLGEPTPYYDARSAYYGIVDLAGLPKDRYYLYQSRWRPELPMAHILPHWTWPGREGEITPVHVFTSGDEAELFVNGESQGRQKKAPYQYRLRWDSVEYAPGELEVVAYRDGKEWARARMPTAGGAARLELSADRERMAADGRDLAFVTVRVTDAEGRTAPRAKHTITFSLDGPGELVATDNGDPTSFVPFPSPVRDAFNGYAIAIIRGIPGRPGEITVCATGDGLADATVGITTSD